MIQIPSAGPGDTDFFLHYNNGVSGKSQWYHSPGLGVDFRSGQSSFPKIQLG